MAIAPIAIAIALASWLLMLRFSRCRDRARERMLRVSLQAGGVLQRCFLSHAAKALSGQLLKQPPTTRQA
jgi:hypothetical protein